MAQMQGSMGSISYSKCAHPGCMCDVAPGKKYCSDYREQNAEASRPRRVAAVAVTPPASAAERRGSGAAAPRASPGNHCCRL